MGDRMNLAGKDLVVNSVTEMRRRKSSDFQSVRNATSSAANSQAIEGLGYIVDDMGGTVTQVTASMSRIGARRNASSIFSLDVYAYNPRNSYSSDYASDYYVQTGYVSANGMALPVAVNTRYVTFAIPATPGTWAIAVRKANALDEAYTPYVIFPAPDANNVMRWTDSAGQSFIPDANGGTWIIGSFLYDANNGLLNLFIQQEALSPSDFLKNRFMQIMNDVSGSDTTDYINWAIAMGCDAIFKRLAAIEAFVSRLNVNNLTVGTPGNGFSFQALSDDGNGNKVFDVRYNSSSLFHVVVSGANAGKIYFGSGFWYDPSDSAIHSTDDNVVINSAGEITAKGASILGNSSFKGSFDCTAIKTAIASPYVQASATTTVINKTQGRNLAGTIRGLALGTGKIPARISGVTSAVAYVDYQYTESSAGSIYKVNFYNSSYTLLDIRNILSCTSSGNHSDNYSICYYSPNIGSERYTYANSSFTVEFMAGGNTLLLDIPSSATGLTSGMVYRDGSSLKVVP